MARKPVALVAAAAQEEVVRSICGCTEIDAVLNLGRARLNLDPVPVLRDMEELLDRAASGTCCFLHPFPALNRRLPAFASRKVHVLSAGPISLSRRQYDQLCESAGENHLRWSWGNRYRFSRLHQALQAQVRNPAFGNPVYLRQVRGGGHGLLSAWWSACEALDQARTLLGAPLRELLVAASRQGSQHHVVLTVSAANQSNAQLAIAPVHLPINHDITLLGSGGLLFSDGVSNSSPIVHEKGLQLQPHTDQYPEPAWLVDFLGQLGGGENPLPDWPTLNLNNRMLRAIRLALREGQPVRVDLQGRNNRCWLTS
jgi:predicted dehydrogenase